MQTEEAGRFDAVVYVATSVDGFIARQDGSLDWLPDAEANPSEDYGWGELMSSIDAVVMGRATFEVARVHPGSPYGDVPIFVLSTRDLDVDPDTGWEVERLSGDVDSIVADLVRRGLHRVYVDGGVVIQAFLRRGLVRRITVTQLPILLGSGIRLFGDLESDVHLHLRESRSWENGWVQLTYDVVEP